MWILLVPNRGGLSQEDKQLAAQAEAHLLGVLGSNVLVVPYPHDSGRLTDEKPFKAAAALATQPGNLGLILLDGSRGWTAPWQASVIMDTHLYGAFHYNTGVFSVGPAYPQDLRKQLSPHFCKGIPSADERWDAAVIQLQDFTPVPPKWPELIKGPIRSWHLAAIIDVVDRRKAKDCVGPDGSVTSRTTPKAPWGYTILFPVDSPRPDETWATLFNEVEAFDFSRIAVLGPLEGILKDGQLDNRFWVFDPYAS